MAASNFGPFLLFSGTRACRYYLHIQIRKLLLLFHASPTWALLLAKTYTRDGLCRADFIGQKLIPNLPRENRRLLRFVLCDFITYGISGHSRLGSTDCTR